MSRLSIIVAGMVAGQPRQGGAAWAVLQYVHGLAALGHDVTLVEPVAWPATAPPDRFATAPAAEWFRRIVATCGIDGRAALLRAGTRETIGLSHDRLVERCRRADLLLNISGMLRDEALLGPVPRRVFLDLDPAFNQIWHAQGVDMGFDRHTHFVTIAWRIGQPGCTVPGCGRRWITTAQPVVLDQWPVATELCHDALTTVAHWRSYGTVTHEGVFHGQKAHAWRPLADLPGRCPIPCRPALAIHPGDDRDVALLRGAGWEILDPAVHCATPDDYRRFVSGSRVELGIAKQGYVVSRSGWFSDRSGCYLAAGRPVIAHDTGFGERLPTGRGLFAFTTIDDIRAAVDALRTDEGSHRRAAREIAAAVLDSRVVLPALLAALAGAG